MQKYYEINGNGSNIRCKLYYGSRPEAGRAVIFLPGFSGHRDNRTAARLAEKMISKHRDAVLTVFDWPCHGSDVKKKLTLSDCDAYLSAVIEHAKERFGAKELYAAGVSFGGYLALKYISEHGDPFKKTVLLSTAVDMYSVLTASVMKEGDLERLMKGRGRGKEVTAGFDRKIPVTAAFLDELRGNDIRGRDFLEYAGDILMIHGTKDEIVPEESARRFADGSLIEYLPVEGADHRFSGETLRDLFVKYTLDFFDL